MTKTRCAAPLAELSKKAHRSLLCYVPQAWFSADDMDGAADFQLPKRDGARTYVESTESDPIELGAAVAKLGFVLEQEDFLSTSGTMHHAACRSSSRPWRTRELWQCSRLAMTSWSTSC